MASYSSIGTPTYGLMNNPFKTDKNHIPKSIEDYWGLYPEDFSMNEADVAGGDVLQNMQIRLHTGFFNPHIAALFEMCNYLKLPYPQAEFKKAKKKTIRVYRLEGSILARQKPFIGPQLAWIENNIKALETTLEALVPYLASAVSNRLKDSRLRALRDILLWELCMNSAMLEGYLYPGLFH